MILPKHELQERKAVSGFLSDSQFQPAGVDLTLREAFSFSSEGSVDFDNSERKLAETKPLAFDEKGWLHLPKGAYKVVYNEIVSIPSDCAGLAYPRSTLLRCGAFLHCAVWDPGYKGRSESLLVVENEKGIRLKKNAKLVQLILIKLTCDAKETYKGKYHNENL